MDGLVVTRGDLILEEESQIENLLLHLGRGQLVLTGNSRVQGGIWLSNPVSRNDQLTARPLNLNLSGDAAIVYNLKEIQKGLRDLPPTQLSWRLLFWSGGH